MKIVLQWDSSVTNLPAAQRTEFEAAITDAADFYDKTLANNLTVTINVGYGEITDGGTTTLSAGESEGGPGEGGFETYSQLRTALLSSADSPIADSADGWLPTTDPYDTSEGYFVPAVEMELLGQPLSAYGLTAADATGSVGFGAPQPGASYDYDPLNRALSGNVDLIGIAEHEISHALGRISNASLSGSTRHGEDVLDLFRFSSPGVVDLNSTTSTYFSTNGGQTVAKAFDDTNSDPADWLSSTDTGSQIGDSYDAFYTTGEEGFVTATDLQLMNVLGYQITDMLPQDAVSGDNVSDVLIQNTAGAVVYGEIIDQQLQYTSVVGLGPEWTFVGIGDYLGNHQDGYLIENTNGVVVLGNAATGAFTVVGGLGPQWTFEESGDVFGDGKAQYIIENTNGAVVAGEISGTTTTYTQIGALGPEWAFVGAGDYEGDGKFQLLIENTAGVVDVAELGAGMQATYTQVTGLGPEWRFVGTGDYLDDGKDQFLIENTAGAVVVGEISGSTVAYTQVAALGPEWKFIGSGDYAQTGQDSFLIENTAGVVVTGTVVGGQAQYQVVGGLGPEWRFRS